VDRKEGPMPMRWLVIVIRIGIILRGGERRVASAIAVTRVAAGNDGGGTAVGGWPPFIVIVGVDANAERADY